MNLRSGLVSVVLAGASLFSGCAAGGGWQKDAAVGSIPVAAGAAYFGAVGTHESGHALTAALQKGESIKVSVLPSRHEGHLRLGQTSYVHGDLSSLERSLFDVAGVSASFTGQIAARELLKSEEVPSWLQPTLQWYALFNKVSFYGHLIRGFASDKDADLGKQPPWVSGALLVVGLSYDIYDFLSDDPRRYFGVLFGQEFYESKDSSSPRLILSYDGDRAFVGIGGRW